MLKADFIQKFLKLQYEEATSIFLYHYLLQHEMLVLRKLKNYLGIQKAKIYCSILKKNRLEKVIMGYHWLTSVMQLEVFYDDAK